MTAFEYLGKLAVDEHGHIEHLRFYRSKAGGSLLAVCYTYRNQYGRNYEEILIEDGGVAFLCEAPDALAVTRIRLEQDPAQLFMLPRTRVLPW